MAALQIEVFSDVTCPWCFIGTRRLADALATVDGGADAVVTHRPFLLNPDVPAEGIDLAAHLGAKYGRDPGEMFAVVRTAAERSGLDLDPLRQPRTYPTIAAHTLLRHAEARGTAPALLDALFGAYFQDVRNVADPDVLAEVGGTHGFAPDEVRHLITDVAELARTREEAGRAARLGIRGVPHFVFSETLEFSGAQAPEVFQAALKQAAA
jgi:predicted DsbA family dithiol-disulfide isomerase